MFVIPSSVAGFFVLIKITRFEYPYEYFLALLGAPSADVCFAHTPPHVRKLEIHKTKKKPLKGFLFVLSG